MSKPAKPASLTKKDTKKDKKDKRDDQDQLFRTISFRLPPPLLDVPLTKNQRASRRSNNQSTKATKKHASTKSAEEPTTPFDTLPFNYGRGKLTEPPNKPNTKKPSEKHYLVEEEDDSEDDVKPQLKKPAL